MGHRVHADLYNKDGKVITSVRNGACDSGINPFRHHAAVKWVRYIEVKNCKYSAKEVKAWVDFCTRCGFKSYLSLKEQEVKTGYGGRADSKCYSITLLRKDYKNDLHLFIAGTLIRMISYDIYPCYQEIPKVVFNMKDLKKATSLEKLILAHYGIKQNVHGYHGLFYTGAGYNVWKLQKFSDLKLTGGSINAVFQVPLKGITNKKVRALMDTKKYKEAYALLKSKEKEDAKG